MKNKLGLFLVLPLLFCGACSSETIAPNSTNESEGGSTLKEFSDVKLESKTYNYDGQPHSIEVTGTPEGTIISYTNNNKTEIGTYNVKATLTKEGYEAKTLSGVLVIKDNRKEFTGLTFESQNFSYDGNYHSLEVENVPEGAEVIYSSNNNQKNIGTYKITATIKKEGYKTVVLTATMKIVENVPTFPEYNIQNYYLIYDGQSINLKLYFKDYESTLSRTHRIDYNVVYKVNDIVMNAPTVKDVGVYTVSATYSAPDYQNKTISFTLTISNKIGGVDTTKTAFNFTENTKFKDLYNEIMKGNFSVKRFDHTEYDHNKDGIFEEKQSTVFVGNYFVTPDAFAGEYNENGMYFIPDNYYITKGTDYAFKYGYQYFMPLAAKFPVSTYSENVMEMSYGMLPFTILKENAAGGFEKSSIGGNPKKEGTFFIDTVNNQLLITARAHYTEEEWMMDEVQEYVFHNIGNTKVTIPEEIRGRDVDAATLITGDFIENGIRYLRDSFGKESFIADVTIDEADDAYLNGGTYTLRPEIDGCPIKEITCSSFNVNHSKYTLDVYFNEYGYYQGQYKEAGGVKNYSMVSKYGHINYYGSW